MGVEERRDVSRRKFLAEATGAGAIAAATLLSTSADLKRQHKASVCSRDGRLASASRTLSPALPTRTEKARVPV